MWNPALCDQRCSLALNGTLMAWESAVPSPRDTMNGVSSRPQPRPVALTLGTWESRPAAAAYSSSGPVGGLLTSLGFWQACRAEIPTRNDFVFRGPWEYGQLEGDELLAFASQCRIWADRYTESGPIKAAWLLGGGTKQPVWVQAPRSEVRQALLTMADLAEQAHREHKGLFIET